MASRRVAITRINALSVLRTALFLALAGLVAWVICVCLLYVGLDAAGVWDAVNAVIGGAGGEGTITFQIVLGAATLLGAIVALLIVVMAPITAARYNAFAGFTGGISITMSNRR